MAISYTGLSYLFGFFVFSLLALRLYRYSKTERSEVSHVFFYFALSLTAFFLVTAVIGLFFYQNTFVLKLNVVIAAFLQGLACSFLGYNVVLMKFPHRPPLIGFWIVFVLTILSTILAIITPFSPFFEEASRAIHWNVPLVVDIPRTFIFLFTLVPLALIFFQQFLSSSDPVVRIRAVGLGFVMFIGFLAVSVEFILEKIFKLGALSSDIALGVVYLLLLLYLLFAPKYPFSTYRKEKGQSLASS